MYDDVIEFLTTCYSVGTEELENKTTQGSSDDNIKSLEEYDNKEVSLDSSTESKNNELIEEQNKTIKIEGNESLQDWPNKYWSHNILPDSFYLFNLKKGYKTKYFLYKSCKSEELDIFKIHPKKLARLLTDLDILFIINILPNELVHYDGSSDEDYISKFININYLRNKNIGLINFFSNMMKITKKHNYFLKVMKYLKDLRNLNSLECLSKAFKSQRLKKKELKHLSKLEEDISTYFMVRQKVKGYSNKDISFIYPLDLFLKDVVESNLNINEEDSSMRFCRLMEMLVSLQNSIHNFSEDNSKENIKKRMKNKYEHFFLFNAFKYINHKSRDSKFINDSLEGVFLLL